MKEHQAATARAHSRRAPSTPNAAPHFVTPTTSENNLTEISTNASDYGPYTRESRLLPTRELPQAEVDTGAYGR